MAKEDVVESRQPTELAHNRLAQAARDLRLELDSELEMDIGILPEQWRWRQWPPRSRRARPSFVAEHCISQRHCGR